jgi:NADH-quinone oxidoreductase subunit M
MGIYPESFMKPMRNDVGLLVERLERATPQGDSHLTLGKGAAHTEGEHHGEGH